MTEENKLKQEFLLKALRESKNAVEYLRAQANLMEAYPDHDNIKLLVVCTLERYKCDHCPKTHNNPAMSMYMDSSLREQIGADFPAIGLLESCKAMILNNIHGLISESDIRKSFEAEAEGDAEDNELEGESFKKKDHVH